jgi:hypothetical protein
VTTRSHAQGRPLELSARSVSSAAAASSSTNNRRIIFETHPRVGATVTVLGLRSCDEMRVGAGRSVTSAADPNIRMCLHCNLCHRGCAAASSSAANDTTLSTRVDDSANVSAAILQSFPERGCLTRRLIGDHIHLPIVQREGGRTAGHPFVKRASSAM